MMIYLGEDPGGNHIIRIDDFDIMNRLYRWTEIREGIFIGNVRRWPWSPDTFMEDWERPELTEWRAKYAVDERGMPLVSIRWRDAKIREMMVWRLHFHFYRAQAATLFRLTFG